jgi:ComF family protein
MTQVRPLSLALDLLFPRRCAGCGTFGAFLCASCLASSPRAAGERCPRCWRAGREETCLDCYRFTPAFAALRSAFAYGGVPRSAVLALKYKGVSSAAEEMAVPMADTLAMWNPPVDAVAAVPLNWVRKRTRGYNQAESLARQVARRVDLPYAGGVLRRVKRTPPQVQQPDALARHQNVAGAFGRGTRPAPARILLVDDVATTGATLDACSRVLLSSGAREVFALTFARED